MQIYIYFLIAAFITCSITFIGYEYLKTIQQQGIGGQGTALSSSLVILSSLTIILFCLAINSIFTTQYYNIN